MEEVDSQLTNEDLAKFINFLENPNDPRQQQYLQLQHQQQLQQLQHQQHLHQQLQGHQLKLDAGLGQGFPSLGGMAMLAGSQWPNLAQPTPQFPQHTLFFNPPQQTNPLVVPPQAPQPSSPPALPALHNNSNPPEFGNLPSQQLLNEIYHLQIKQKKKMEKMRHIQKQVMVNPQKQAFDMLDLQQKQLKSAIDSELKALQQLSQQIILPPNEIHRLLFLQQDLRIQLTQLELYHQELQQLMQPHPPNCCIAALIIVEDPFPLVITKGKQLDDDPIVVQLLSGANVEFQSFSKVKVAIVCDNQQGKANNQKTIENDTQTMDVFRRVVKWHLKFLNGTRKNAVNLRFGMQVQVSQGPGSAAVTIESNNSQPLIVITNECQWEESEGVLIKKDAFGDQPEIMWAYFANILQRHFLRATRQDPIRPTRCLSPADFEYLNQKFFGGQSTISQKAFDNFWAWFGKGIQKLRYQRHICPLWQTGLIHGFVSREYVEEALVNQEVGTFLIRFSERHSGLFAVAYRIEDPDPKQQVRHYLVRPDDTAGAKKTLPDFLSEQTSFMFLLQVTYDADGKAILRKFSKHAVLEPYCSKRNSLPQTNGYDDGISTAKNDMIE